MIKKILWAILLINMILISVQATDVYVNFNFNYEFGTNSNDVQVKVFKCQDSSCDENRVSQIQTHLYQQNAKQACFGDLTHQQMINCMNNFRISGDKAPSQGAVVRLTDVSPNQREYYYLVFSVRGDTFLIPYYKLWVQTSFTDYDYVTSDLRVDFTKSFRPKANIQSFFVDNLENPDLPIQVNVEAGMSSTVCSGFVDISGNLKRPQFDSGFSDYAARTRISLQVIDRQTGNIIASDSTTMNIEASTCTGFHQFQWTPPSNFENREVEFRVVTDIVDEQAHLPRRDQDSKIAVVYPEDLTNACWVVANNLVVANRDTTNPQVGDFVITIGEDAFLSFEALAYRSRDRDGHNLQFIDYRARISVDGTLIIDEVVTSNSGLFQRNIGNLLTQFNEGEVEVRATLDPVGADCSMQERTTLTTLVDLKKPQVPDTPPTLNTPNVLNGGINQQVSGSVSAFDQEDGDLTNQISCSTNSNLIYVNVGSGTLTVVRTTDNSISTSLICQVQDSDNNRVTRTTQVRFDEIEPEKSVPTIHVPNILNAGTNQQVQGKVSASDSKDGDLTNQISCTRNSNLINVQVSSGTLTVTRNTGNPITSSVTCQVTNSDGNSAQGTTQIRFSEIKPELPDTPPTLNTPDLLNGETNQQVTGTVSAFDQEDGDLTNQISCTRNSNLINVQVSSGTLTVTRNTDNSISTSLTCEVTDSDNNRVTKNTQVRFTEIRPDTPPTLNTPDELTGGLNQRVTGTVSAFDQEDGDLTNQIICAGNPNIVNVQVGGGTLTVTRLTNGSITTNVACTVEDSDGNRVSKNTRVTFDKIVPESIPTINVPNLLNGGFNEQVQGQVSASDSKDGDLTNQIMCNAQSNTISVNVQTGTLTVTRNSDNSISTTVVCEVTNSDGNSAQGTTQIRFSEIKPDTPPELHVPKNLNGGINQDVSGQVSAFDQEDGDLTNQISCVGNRNIIDVEVSSGTLTVTRLIENTIMTQVVCSVEDSDGNRVTKNTLVTFERVPKSIPTIHVPNLLDGQLNQQVQGQVSASDSKDGDLTNQIMCNAQSNTISVNVESGTLTVTRNTDNQISTTVVCEVTNSDGNSAQGTTQVRFSEIAKPNNPPVLNTPDLLDGQLNQQVQGQVSAFDQEDGDLTNQIVCFSPSSVVNAQASNGVLTVVRTTNNSISTLVTCQVTDSDNNRVTKDTQIRFSEIKPDTPPVLHTPDLLDGQLNQQVQGQVSAFDEEDGDLTNQISCTAQSNRITVDVSSGTLTITREDRFSIDTQVNCEVTNSNGLSAQGTTRVVFDMIDNPPVLETPDLLDGGLNQQVQGQVSAFDEEDGDLTNQISCAPNSNVISVDVSSGTLTVTRNTQNAISTSLTCEVTDSDNNRVTKDTQVRFTQISAPTLNVPELLNGSVNEQVQGQVSAQDQIDGDLTNQISCTAQSNRITVDVSSGILTVTRLDRFSIDEQVNCEVTNSNGLSAQGTTRVVFDLQNQAPQVTLTPSVTSGFEILHIDFEVSAVDPDGDQITCEVFVNGVSRFTNNCEGFNKEFEQGTYNVRVVVTDEFGLTGENSVTIEVFEKLPQEVTLNVTPQRVFVGDPVQIDYSVVDDADFVNCVLETNGRLLQAIGGGNCVGDFTRNTSYSEVGTYTVTLTTVDKNGLTVIKTQEVEVIEALSPQGTLRATPKESFAPSNITVTVNITHPQNLSVTCEVFNNGQIIGTECVEVITLENVAGGTYTFTARGVDERGNMIELTDSIVVFREEDKLPNQDIIVDTESGDNSNVDVTITFANETLAQRVTRFRPYIVCEDEVTNGLKNEQWINAALKTRTMMNNVEFNFELFINDFQLRVEYDRECTLVVEFWDNYGFIDQRSAPITFVRPTQEAGIPSIRGQGIDFRNHLTTLLQDSTFTTGNNRFSVVLINNEDEVKVVDYTITGQQINVRSSGSFVLQPFEERVVPMTINVPQGSEDGTYLVRITMTHNGVRESKLTHIRVGENAMLPTYTVSQNEEGFGQSRSISLPDNCTSC